MKKSAGSSSRSDNKEHHPRPLQHFRGRDERPRRVRRARRAGIAERGHDPPPLLRPRAWRNDRARLRVEPHQPHRVTLPKQQERDRGRDTLGVFALGEPRGIAAPVHRPAHVEHDGRAQIRFLFVLLHEPLVGPREHFPVDVPQIVAGLVGAMLRELDGEALARRFVQPGEKSVHDPSRHNLQSPEGGDGGGVQQVGAQRRW